MKIMRTLLLSCFLGLLSLNVLAGEVNINTADAKTLEALNGVGEKTAKAIVEYRTEHGPFKTVEDLSKVKGIGAKIIDKNRDNMTVK